MPEHQTIRQQWEQEKKDWRDVVIFLYEHAGTMIVLGVIGLLGLIIWRGMTDNYAQYQANLAAAPARASAYLERLGKPVEGEMLCHTETTFFAETGIACDAVVGGVPVRLVCATTCQLGAR